MIRKLKRNNFTSVKLVDFSIKLDYNGEFPIADMKKLKEVIGNNKLAFSVQRKLIVNNLYMFPTTYQQRQTIFDTMNISMEAQRKIESTTLQAKK